MMMELWRLLIISILVFSPSFISGDTDQSDASALNVMFSSMNSPPQLTGWTASGGDPCGQSWKGVTCSGSRVTQIKISNLGLTGSIGFQLTSLTSLTDFDISHNNFGGTVPYNLPPNLQRLNLAGCNFNGAVPYSISTMKPLVHLDLSQNQFNGQLNVDFSQLTSLSNINLANNALTGNLPQTMSSLTSLKTLNLQNNQFTGTIDVLGDLPLENLNIANNHFTGWVPRQLQNINIQKDGNSWNSGPAPPAPPGSQTNHHKSGNHGKLSESSSSGDGKSGISAGAIVGIILAIVVVVAVVGFILFKRRIRRPSPDVEKVDIHKPFVAPASNDVEGKPEYMELKSVHSSSSINTTTLDTVTAVLKPPPLDRNKSFDDEDFSNKPVRPIVTKIPTPVPENVKSYSIADLQMATGSFSVENLIGEGSIGRVYRAQFDDGKVLAVKKIDSSVLANHPEDFTEVVASISKLHHPNVTELVGYCSEHGQHLLMYEFHKNGSLNDFLHLDDEYSKPLTWNTRVKIALGSARALEYLHEVCSPSVVHQNFKSENILLDVELNPHLSDCGLANLLPNANQAINHNACAPEVADSGQYTLKSDVYSFGVVMLELLSGRKPFDSSLPRAEQSLVRWATPQLHDIDALTKMVDPALEGLYPVKSLSRFADVIALCVQPEPEFRPPMSEVVQALVRLVQRANMSKRTVGNAARQSESTDTNDSVN
ncbi:protein STRUBBELIG-RECEPTOR FAMILY 7-like [Chenopodium quinoa]|uniref:protein STRUBBELIG-RECEPTOR FAMILY 7-like n=1 Tax=Chenopodium quinoa TaxID=63459 RepID=UPI000B77B02D|nr:protein STRUBBELIG-RECEPTOR FAMILY 7-like [Chenopodium quinoa]